MRSPLPSAAHVPSASPPISAGQLGDADVRDVSQVRLRKELFEPLPRHAKAAAPASPLSQATTCASGSNPASSVPRGIADKLTPSRLERLGGDGGAPSARVLRRDCTPDTEEGGGDGGRRYGPGTARGRGAPPALPK